MKITNITRWGLLLAWCIMILSGCGGGGGGGGGGNPVVPPPPATITDTSLLTALKSGSAPESFAGFLSYLRTEIPFVGLPLIPADVTVADSVKNLVIANANAYLVTSGTPQFSAGSSPYPGGVTVSTTPAPPKISVLLGGDATIYWAYEKNKVTRVYTSPTKKTTYTFSLAVDGTTSASFDETITTSDVQASYTTGTATYYRNSTDGSVSRLVSAQFSQKYLEKLSNGNTNILNGTVTMGDEATTPNLSFSGDYSFYLPSYGTVSGGLSAAGMLYERGTTSNGIPIAQNSLTPNSTVTFTPTSTNVKVTNPLWISGNWTGSVYIDGSSAAQGVIIMSAVTDSPTITWSAQMFDEVYQYGPKVTFVTNSRIELYNDLSGSLLWGTASWSSDARIEGRWNYGGRAGTFVLTKQ